MSGSPTTGADGTRISRRDHDQIFDRNTDQLHRFILGLFRLNVLEAEDVHFHLDSAVMMPDFGDCNTAVDPADQNHVSGLAVLRTAYAHAQRHEDELLLLAGHTDRSASNQYNFKLSQERADSILHLLLGNRQEWVNIAKGRHRTLDKQQILKWVANTFGWPCDPGPLTDSQNARTTSATRAFQERYNTEFDPDISVDGAVGEQTWGAFFDLYMRGLKMILNLSADPATSDAELASLRANLKFLNDSQKTVGCGEEHPVTANTFENQRSRIDRRVELLFFDPAERPQMNCHPGTGPCQPAQCELYGARRIFERDPIPCLDWTALQVHLQLRWMDPAGTEHDFPRDFPVTVVFPSDNSTQNERVGDNGRLSFFMNRLKGSFTLRFDTRASNAVPAAGNKYFASAPQGSTDPLPERYVAQDQIVPLIDQGFRIWKAPDEEWELSQWDFPASAQPSGTGPFNATFANGVFSGLEDVAVTVGRTASPFKLTLDPHWQFMKFLYFDRFLKQRLSVLPCVVDGFLAANDPAPHTRSNWTTSPQACQCLPWPIQRDRAGAASARPNANIMLRTRTVPKTYIESHSDRSRNLISLQSANSGGTDSARRSDPDKSAGRLQNLNMDAPGAGRMRFYDLPEVWKSTDYWVRQERSGSPNAFDEGRFQTLADRATTNDRPLIFSYDDMVMTDSDGNLTPINWSTANDRLAIFSHRFDDQKSDGSGAGDRLTSLGLYKSDTAAGGVGTPWFSEKVADTQNRNYVADYPTTSWVRLLIAQGNLFDVFDRRTPDQANRVVGARAAVRWVDATASPNGVAPNTQFANRPSLTRSQPGLFFVEQPFYETINPVSSNQREFDANSTGRFDMAVLRCCDVEDTTEIGLNLHYMRLAFDFNPTSQPGDLTAGSTPSGLSGNVARAFERDAINNIINRWNGDDGLGGGVDILPQAASPALRLKARWFAQAFPVPQQTSRAHFLLRVFLPDTRAFMSSFRGDGALGLEDNPGPWVNLAGPAVAALPGVSNTPGNSLVIAHEAGHGDGLPDEYTESSRAASYFAGDAIYSFNPGSPYTPDSLAMMLSNQRIRARYFWHAAEWLSDVYRSDSIRFQVRQVAGPRTFNYRLPAHPSAPKRLHTTRPLQSRKDATLGARGKFDLFLYPLGEDHYSKTVLGRGVLSSRAGQFWDAILCVVVKMKFTCHSKRVADVQGILGQVAGQIDRHWNNQFFAANAQFNRCILHFSHRYIVTNYPDDPGDANFLTRYNAAHGVSNKSGFDDWVDETIDAHKIHFEVNTRSGGSTAWTDTRELRPTVTATSAAGFENFFGNMIGQPDGTVINASFNAANLNGLARILLSGANVSRIT